MMQNKAAPANTPSEPMIVGNSGPPPNVNTRPMSVIGAAKMNIQNCFRVRARLAGYDSARIRNSAFGRLRPRGAQKGRIRTVKTVAQLDRPRARPVAIPSSPVVLLGTLRRPWPAPDILRRRKESAPVRPRVAPSSRGDRNTMLRRGSLACRRACGNSWDYSTRLSFPRGRSLLKPALALPPDAFSPARGTARAHGNVRNPVQRRLVNLDAGGNRSARLRAPYDERAHILNLFFDFSNQRHRERCLSVR
jgi:hypothetical protein